MYGVLNFNITFAKYVKYNMKNIITWNAFYYFYFYYGDKIGGAM